MRVFVCARVCACMFVCVFCRIYYKGHGVTLYLGCFFPKHSSLHNKSTFCCRIHKFTKLISLCSTCSQAQQMRNELITPAQLPCLHFQGYFALITCKQGCLKGEKCVIMCYRLILFSLLALQGTAGY